MVKDKKVVIKPNCVSATPKSLGKTTHPDLVRALCMLSFMHGAKEVIVAQGSVEADTLRAFELCGITIAVSDLKYVKLVDMNRILRIRSRSETLSHCQPFMCQTPLKTPSSYLRLR